MPKPNSSKPAANNENVSRFCKNKMKHGKPKINFSKTVIGIHGQYFKISV